ETKPGGTKTIAKNTQKTSRNGSNLGLARGEKIRPLPHRHELDRILCSVVIAFVGFVIAAEIHPDEPFAVPRAMIWPTLRAIEFPPWPAKRGILLAHCMSGEARIHGLIGKARLIGRQSSILDPFLELHHQ